MSASENEVRWPRRIDALAQAKIQQKEQKRQRVALNKAKRLAASQRAATARESRRVIAEASMRALAESTARIKAEAEATRFRVLRLMCEGLAPKQIAGTEGITAHAVRHHVRVLRAYAKAKNTAQLVVWAVKQGHV